MTSENRSKLITILVGVLIAVVVVQSVVMAKLYGKVNSPLPIAVDEPVRMNLLPKAGGASSASAKPDPVSPLSGFGINPGTWDPFSEFRNLRQQMDQMFNDSFGRFQLDPDFQSMWSGTTFSPSMDLEEKNGNYVIRIDIPGTDKSNISVNIKDRELRVSGKVDETVEEQGGHHLRKERRSGEFKRVLNLPGPVKAGEMEAWYEDGVLTITVPKDEEQRGSRSIEIK